MTRGPHDHIAAPAPPPAGDPGPRPLAAIDVEAIRVAHERDVAVVIERHPLFAEIAARLPRPDATDERRRLMAESLRLSAGMAPDAHRIAHQAQRVLGVVGHLELYQRSGPENAAMHLVAAPILLEIHGSLLPRLDPGALLALFGHELGHFIAHGPGSPHQAAARIPRGLFDDLDLDAALSRLSMARELTADRVALLACQDLTALLRLMLVTVSGLAVGELTYDTDAYLAQCKDLIEHDLRTGAVAQGETHPEHGLRVYAAWLFSETQAYRALTGRGPGTRDLAEVDAVIARCLGDGPVAVRDPIQAADVPREFLECALAAAVLVAHADGELSDDELALLEHVFASEVADWQAYLDPAVAVTRFLETATVLAPSAHELGPALLNLLFEVVLADGEIHGAELGRLLEIGRALGVGGHFARALTAMLRHKGIIVDLAAVAPPEQPLPARRADVDAALQAYLAGVVRRGESTVTLRRLLRLLGSDRRTDASIATLARAFADHRVTAAPPLADAALDQPLRLAPAAPIPAPAAAPPLPASRAALVVALRRLREQLVSGDGRSPAVRLRALRRGRAFDVVALERVSIGMAERVMAQVRARKSVRVIDAADAGRHGPASVVATELLALAREDAQRTEETGARDLYVGYPFVSGTVAGYLVRAPLVLYPVELTRDGAGARGFRFDPRRDELPIANQSLVRLIFNKRGFAFTDELADELEALAGDPAGGPEAVRARLAEVGLVVADGATALQPFRELADAGIAIADGLTLEELAVVGLFPQSSSDLLQDYDGLLLDLARPDADVGALLAAAATLLPGEVTGAGAAGAGAGLDWAPVIPADPSQRAVIAEARRHGATVIDGPPGTGKSQVIVNLVAEALRRGERVAVVCEKRAALDVVRQRMTAIGFGKALAVVHDVHEDRKPLFAHVATRLEATGRIPFAAAEAEAVRAEHAQVTAALADRAAALQATAAGLDLTVGELLTFAAQQPPPPLPADVHLERLAQADLRTLLDLTVALHPLADVWGPASRWRSGPDTRPRPSLATTTPAGLGDLEAGLERALAAARAYAERAAAMPAGVTVDHVDAARAALDVAVATRAARTDDRDRAVFGTVAQLAATEPERLHETGQALAAVRDGATALERLEYPVSFEGSPGLVASLAVLTRLRTAWYRVFVPGWWRARGRFRAELGTAWPERAGADLTPTLFEDTRDRLTASKAWRTIGDVFTRLGLGHVLPTTASQLAPTIARVAAMADGLRALGAARGTLSAAGAWLPDGSPTPAALATWDAAVDQRRALLDDRAALRAAVTPLRAWFPWLSELPTVAVVDDLLAAWRRDATRLAEADGLVDRATRLFADAPSLLDAAATTWADRDAAAWRRDVLAAWADAWLGRFERAQRTIADLGHGADDREVERLAARLRELETERRELEIERTLARLDDAELLTIEAAAKHQRRTPAQKLREELLKEARKQRMLMPLRTFVRRYAPAGLLDVAPVWLVSPETMAILFPRQPLFDLVVFDEASQCTVEAGLPVLLRAKRVVIAGDEQQMPPSSYFALGAGTDEADEALAGTVDPDAGHDALRDLLTSESLLSLARPRVAHAGLAWHYRCHDEALIAFSNHAMYSGELLTIPSTAGTSAPSALHWVPVADGVYDAGENAPEAARVVDLIDELLARTPRPTVGVVTFNLKQRKAVLDAIDARRATDDAFAARWTDAAALPLDERPFVRNLEQVQGDERDVIVFSLGHAPQARVRRGVATGETYVPARFGPLGQRGGERRLNVAISRARLACYLVASFDPAALSVAAAKHQGPRLFKHFLEFAHHHHHGRRLEAARVLDLVRAGARVDTAHRPRVPVEGFVPLQAQLALALDAAGIPYEADVGASGFRIPVAILDPADPTRFALALLLQDGAAATDPFEAHVHRPGVLRQRGWLVLTVSSASWQRRGREVIAEIEALVPGCRGAATSDLYLQHRAAMIRAAAPTGVTGPIAVSARRGRVVTAPVADDVPADVAAAASGPTTSAPEVPTWALAIEDELFRAALLHLEQHGLMNESELTSMVGGPRRARAFARDLDGWRSDLPFDLEVAVVGGAKSYRKVSRI